MIKASEIRRKNGHYFYGNQEFVVDAYGSIYEVGETANIHFCRLNGRTVKKAIAETLNDC